MGFSFNFHDEDKTEIEETAGEIAKLPMEHSLKDILHSLKDTKISFNSIDISGSTIFRRELFDINHQIMTEDDTPLYNSDLVPNIYEGGFKSWECAYDLVEKLDCINVSVPSILEMGCGTSLPSCYLFPKISNTTLILSDFNYDVLRLVTVPNLILNWLKPEDDFVISEELIEGFLSFLSERAVNLRFISGSWSPQFTELVGPVSLILTSETIYSPQTLPILTKTLLDLCPKGTILLGAKNIYFGVGGSIVEFLQLLNKYKLENVKYEVEEVGNSQLKRSVVVITT